MAGTYPLDALLTVAARSLCAVNATHYDHQPDGSLRHIGDRPDEGWIKHGFFERQLWVVIDAVPERRPLLKQRWKRLEPVDGEPKTCHSRPPDDLASVWSCSLIVALSLWSWLDAAGGLHIYDEVLPGLEDHVSRRNVQRWMRRALAGSLETQQSIRHAVIERSEPRPVERLFPGGPSPPERRSDRRWPVPKRVSKLKTGLAFTIGGALALQIPIPCLLAEARGRWHLTGKPFLI